MVIAPKSVFVVFHNLLRFQYVWQPAISGD